MVMDRRTGKRLRDGIAAVKQGNRKRGRVLLREVLEQAGDVEEAWWWFSQTCDDPVERQRALQRVVALNPDHAEAQAGLLALRLQRLPTTGDLSAGPAWSQVLPDVPLEAEDGIDNPYQCPYCGEPTGTDDRRCPQCRGGLYRRVTVSGNSEPLRRLQLFLGIGLALGLLELISPLLAQAYRQGGTGSANLDLMLGIPGVVPFLGNFPVFTPPAIDLLLKVLAARTVALVLLILGLRARWRLAYYGSMLAVVADLLLNVYLLVQGYLGWAALLLNMAFSLGAGLMLFAVSYEFAVNHERVLVRPDPTARSPLDFYRRGHAYREQGMWAMAVAQWRKAVGLAPRQAEYYKHLGIGYAQIGRFERSLRALREGRRQAADPSELDQIIALVEARAQREKSLP